MKKIFFSLLLFAATSFPQSISITIDQAVETGLNNSKVLKIYNAKIDAAKAKADELNTSSLPNIKFTANYTRLSEVDPFNLSTPLGTFNISPVILDNYGMKLSLSQPLFTGFKLSSGISALEVLTEAEREDYNRQKNLITAQIKSAYWNSYKVKLYKNVLHESVEQISAHLKDAKNLFTQGMLTKTDLLKLEVQLSDVRFKLIEATNNEKLLMQALNTQLGIDVNTQVELKSEPANYASVQYEIDELIRIAMQNRSDLKSTNKKIEGAQYGIKSAQGGYYPSLFLAANYNYAKPNQRIFPAENKFKDTWDVSLVLSYDVWNWFAPKYQTEIAEANYEQATQGLRLQKDGVVLEVNQAVNSFNQSKEKLMVAELGLTLAKENFKISNDRFKQGLATSTEIIDAEVALIQANANYNSALVDIEISVAQINQSIGN